MNVKIFKGIIFINGEIFTALVFQIDYEKK